MQEKVVHFEILESLDSSLDPLKVAGHILKALLNPIEFKEKGLEKSNFNLLKAIIANIWRTMLLKTMTMCNKSLVSFQRKIGCLVESSTNLVC